MGEGREGVLVGVLVCVLVLVLVLVELSPQVGRRAQRGAAVGALRGQEPRVQLLPQEVLFWNTQPQSHGINDIGKDLPVLW